jgi:hypothetical protein
MVISLQKTGYGPIFFTPDIEEFQKGVDGLTTHADEASLVALDFCLDFPWRDASQCHRAVIFLTDEQLETGELVSMQEEKLNELINKIMALKVMLFIVAPESEAYSELSSVDRCEYRVVDSGNGLSSVDFKELLSYIGKSVSRSALQQSKAPEVKRGIFGQESWTFRNVPEGRDA